MKSIHKLIIFLTLLFCFLSFSFMLYLQPAEGKIAAANELRGKEAWQQYNCGACHQVYGLGGYLGPDLTNVVNRRSPEYIQAILKNGIGAMPDFQLTVSERDDIVAYLKYMNTTGNADPRKFTINSDGTITQLEK
jgi:nitric oxide reductase subunit C